MKIVLFLLKVQISSEYHSLFWPTLWKVKNGMKYLSKDILILNFLFIRIFITKCDSVVGSLFPFFTLKFYCVLTFPLTTLILSPKDFLRF